MDRLIIKSFQIYKYQIPLAIPLTVKGHTQTNREGLIIKVEGEANNFGFGEIAPLPGFSQENLEEALTQCQNMKPKLEKSELPEKLLQLNGSFEHWLGKFKLYPSVRFGIEMAVLNLVTHYYKKPLCACLTSDFHSNVRVSALLSGNQKQVIEQAKSLLDEGYVSFKLKVGDSIHVEIEKIKAVSDIVKSRALLHLDANQSWTFEEALEVANAISCTAVEYIEEPFSKLEDIPKFFDTTLIPVALDESLMTHTFDEVKSIEGVDFLILKPQTIGGIERTWNIMQEAKRLAIRTVVSSCFESSLGILTLANLAGCTHLDNIAGLDTLKWFTNDILTTPLKITHGRLDIGQRYISNSDINPSLLTELT